MTQLLLAAPTAALPNPDEEAARRKTLLALCGSPGAVDRLIVRDLRQSWPDPASLTREAARELAAWEADDVDLPALRRLARGDDPVPPRSGRADAERGDPGPEHSPRPQFLRQTIERLVTDPVPIAFGDLDVADAILAVSWRYRPSYSGKLDLSLVNQILTDLPKDASKMQKLATAGFRAAALALLEPPAAILD